MSLSLISRDNNRLVLPTNISIRIFEFLPLKETAICSKVCKEWEKIANDDRVWYKMSLALDVFGSGRKGKAFVCYVISVNMEAVRDALNPIPQDPIPQDFSYILNKGLHASLLLNRVNLSTIECSLTLRESLRDHTTFKTRSENDDCIIRLLIDLKKFDQAIKFINLAFHLSMYQQFSRIERVVDGLCKDNQREVAFKMIKQVESQFIGVFVRQLIKNSLEDEEFCLKCFPELTSDYLKTTCSLMIINRCLDKNKLEKAQNIAIGVESLFQEVDGFVNQDTQYEIVKMYIRLGETEKAFMKAYLQVKNTDKKNYQTMALNEVRSSYLANGDSPMVAKIDKILQK